MAANWAVRTEERLRRGVSKVLEAVNHEKNAWHTRVQALSQPLFSNKIKSEIPGAGLCLNIVRRQPMLNF